MTKEELKNYVRTVHNWPKKGVRFRDVTPLFENPETFNFMVNAFCEHYKDLKIDHIAGVDARGFVIGGAVAYAMGIPFILVRKKGKLPADTISEDYALEYGTATIEVHKGCAGEGDRIAIIDDLIATGGTLLAASRLFKRLGSEVVEVSAVIDLPELGGSKLLKEDGLQVKHLIEFNEDE